MPFLTTASVELCYEEFGSAEDPAVVLIMGLGTQMTGWDPAFCKMIAAAGYRVIRFDNRDSGLSTKVESDLVPNPVAVLMGDHSSLSYELEDLADDTVALMDGLGIQQAHIVGASMGAMIGQIISIRYASRVLSFTSIMGTTGDPNVGKPTPEAVAALLAGPETADRETVVERGMSLHEVLSSPGYPLKDRQVRAFVENNFERNYHPQGAARQFAAVLAARDRTEALHQLNNIPVLVIHGRDDQLINVSGGEATAAAVPGAELLVIDGMGHDLPFALWPQITSAIVANTQRSSSTSSL